MIEKLRTLVRGYGIGLLALLAAVVVVMEGVQLRKFRERLKDTFSAATQPVMGIYVPQIELRDVATDTGIAIGANGSAAVLFVFNTTCDFCRQSIDLWQEAADSLKSLDIATVGISLDSTQQTIEYMRLHELKYPVATFQSVRDRHLYRANTVPYTIVVSQNARIAYSRPGLVTSIAVDSLLAAVRDTSVSPRVSYKPSHPKEAT